MASVTFKRGTRAEIEATAKQDGQILMETDQNKKNKMYMDLPDGSRVLIGNSGEAIDTSYDNTTSGLDATNVQNAIDKIENNVGDISGITDSLTATSSNIALSAAGGNNLQRQIDTLNSNIQYGNMPLMTTGTIKRTEGGMDIYASETCAIKFDRPFKSNNVFIVISECGGNPSRFYQYRYINVTKNEFRVQLFANYPNYEPPGGMWIAIEN